MDSFCSDLPLLPFQPNEVLVPSERKTLHLYKARFLALLEESLVTKKKLFVHFVLVPVLTNDLLGTSFAARYGCLVHIEDVERQEIGALVSIRGIGRVSIMKFVQVGKVSMEWLAGEETKVVGTFPRRRRGWIGHVEKDAAGQTNIYSVERVVYVAENAISSGSAVISSEGAENMVAIVAGLGLASLAAASSILFLVGKNTPPQIQTAEYSGPSLS